jgi:cytochrome b561
MPGTESSQRYGQIAVTLHWVSAALILLNISIGLHMERFPGYIHSSAKWNEILFFHASFGMLILLVTLARLTWRLGHRPPPLPSTLSPVQAKAAHAVHILIYALVLAIPLSGFVHRVTGNHPVSFFGLWTWPTLLSPDESLRKLSGSLHIALVSILAILVLGHIGAALKHFVADRDGIGKRMLWTRRREA